MYVFLFQLYFRGICVEVFTSIIQKVVTKLLYETFDVEENERTNYNTTSITADNNNKVLVEGNAKQSIFSVVSMGTIIGNPPLCPVR